MSNSICSVDGCLSDARVKSMCPKHYKSAHYQRNRERYLAEQKDRRAANPENFKAYGRAYYLRNPQKWVESEKKRDRTAISEYQRQYRIQNLDKVKEAKRQYYLANKERIDAHNLRNYEADRERAKERARNWAKRNPERVRELVRSAKGARRARTQGGIVTRADYRKILAEYGMVCHICELAIESMAHLEYDHVIPLARGGAHSPENIRPSHRFCNRSKGSKLL